MTVQPTLEDAARAAHAVQALLPARLAEADRHALGLAVYEVLSNIVRHGFAGSAGSPIELVCTGGEHAFVVDVRDRGCAIPADRFAAAGPDAFAFDPDDLAALPQSGLGLAIVKAAFDVVEYGSEAGVNCMHLEKRIA
jgi:serine/threonine-protein kinase RsbW